MTHERIFDAKMLSSDVEGGIFKPGRSLFSIMRQIFNYRRGKLGQINIQFGDAINLRDIVPSNEKLSEV